jgi:hypothetical protein
MSLTNKMENQRDLSTGHGSSACATTRKARYPGNLEYPREWRRSIVCGVHSNIRFSSIKVNGKGDKLRNLGVDFRAATHTAFIETCG